MSIDFDSIDAAKLTVAQLKQGLTLYGAQIPVGNKPVLIKAFDEVRKANKIQSSMQQTAELDDVKTQQLDIETPKKQKKNAFQKNSTQKQQLPNEDLTQTAFSITGAQPINNQQIQQQLIKEKQLIDSKTSPQKQLKANVDFEKTPQSMVKQSVDLENFMQSQYVQNSVIHTKNYDVTDQFSKQLNLTKQQLDLLQNNSEGYCDEYQAQMLSTKVHQNDGFAKKSVRFNQTDDVLSQQNSQGSSMVKNILKDNRSKLQIDDLQLIRKQQEVNKKLSFNEQANATNDIHPQRVKLIKNDKQFRTVNKQNQLKRIFIGVMCCSLFLIFIIQMINIKIEKQLVHIPLFTFFLNKLFIFVLPKDYINESTSFSLQKPVFCPSHSQCNQYNEVNKCDYSYKQIDVHKSKASSNIRFKIHNYLAYLGKIAQNLENYAVGKQPVYQIYATKICSRNQAQLKLHKKLLTHIENNILQLYGNEMCLRKNLKLIKQKKHNFSSLVQEISKNTSICLEDTHSYLQSNEKQRILLIQFLNNSDNDQLRQKSLKLDFQDINETIKQISSLNNSDIKAENQEVSQESQEISEKEELTQNAQYFRDIAKKSGICVDTGIILRSTQIPSLSFGCKIKKGLMMNKLQIIGFIFKYTFLLITLLFLYFRISLTIVGRKATRDIKNYLIHVKETEVSNNASSSAATYAVRADALKHQFLGDKLLIEYIWKKVEKKLQNDYQVDKQWARAKNGEVMEAYYYNGDGIIKIKSHNAGELSKDNSDFSEHSLSY